MAVEIVILVPVLIAVMFLVVALGRFVDSRGVVEAVARDAARAASLERSHDQGASAAQDVIDGSLPGRITCPEVDLLGDYTPGGEVTVRVSCKVSYSGLGFIGMPGNADIVRESTSPIDEYRRTG
jgi:Flp pilus assembly protein TadG